MKINATMKSIKNAYTTIIKTSYCSIQFLTAYKDPFAYTCGVYGWNSDIYEVKPGIAICTGYRPFGNIVPEYETINKYEKEAEKIVNNWNMEHNAKVKAVNYLFNKCMSEILEK